MMELPKRFELSTKASKVEEKEEEEEEESSAKGSSQESIVPPPFVSEELSLSAEELKRIGPELAACLEAQDYHPVVIFGSSNSGKSTFLGSLLAFFKESADLEIGIFLGDPVLPMETTYGKYVWEAAEAFFHRSCQEFIDGTAHHATRARYPFFVPVIVRPKNQPEVKFAFLESNGEWYQADRTRANLYPRLKGEIEGILRHFQRGLSVVYVAPYTQENIREEPVDSAVDQTKIANAGLALIGVMEAYETTRSIKSSDAHIFLITKWDAYTKANLDLKDVLSCGGGEVEDVVRAKYTQAFAAFKNLALGANQRSLMQYCSGLISGRFINRANSDLQPIINRYRRTLWNWLYRNASANHKGVGHAITLMPAPLPPRKTLIERLNELVNAILS
jgi:hypothetical protein